MDLNKLLLGNVMAGQTAPLLGTEYTAPPDNSSNNLSFIQVLDRRIDDTYARSKKTVELRYVEKNTKDPNSESVSKYVYRSYRQVRESNTKQSETGTMRKNEDYASENADVKDDDIRCRSDETAQLTLITLLQMLGIDQKKLETFLAEIGITADGSVDPENVMDIVKTLSGIFNLNKEQESTLEKLLWTAMEQLTEAEESQITTGVGHDNQEAWDAAVTVTDGVQKEVLAGDPIIGQLREQIAEWMDAFSEKPAPERQDTAEEIRNLLLPLLERTLAGKQNVTVKNVVSDSIEDPDSNTEDIMDMAFSEAATAEEEQQDSTDEKDLQMKNGGNRREPVLQPLQSKNEVQHGVFAATLTDHSEGETTVISDKAVQQNVPTREIISQIVEKAGVILTQDKSEMVMDLKPESLGRISLKVVTENGIVMAKFVAENRQVQQVLESNMQILKDSLENQGINVQSLSVSVRQGSSQSDANGTQYPSRQRTYSIKEESGAASGITIARGFIEGSDSRNPYLWGDSTINLTA